ncbi:uncharacterized protein LOC129730569 [Wyeomyia smithii]|uniref:uncharacterized protein LOC129730569 n=1 Tax=Wyeomyia smithii TaxID=174621 RepID=UPI002467C3A5|nr:uncharacterized protein LOC129730569 [Wyeomyia smithii]
MDKISLTDIRLRFFGPTLDESVLYGIDCLMDIFTGKTSQYMEEEFELAAIERSGAKKAHSDLHLYKSCHDVTTDENISGTGSENAATPRCSLQPDENHDKINEAGSSSVSFKMDATNEINEKLKIISSESSQYKNAECVLDDTISKRSSVDLSECKCSDQVLRVLSEARKSSNLSTDQTSSRRSSKDAKESSKKRIIASTPLHREPWKPSRTSKQSSSSDQSSKPKTFSNSKTIEKLKRDLANSNLMAIKTSHYTPNNSHQDQYTSRKRSSSVISRPSTLPKLLAKPPRRILTRWAVTRVIEYDDGAKTFEMFPPWQQNPFGLANFNDLPPEVSPEVVFANLPDGSTCSYRFDSARK